MSQKGQFYSTGITELRKLTGDAGGAVPPLFGNVDVLGSANITTVGDPLANTVTWYLKGTTDHALQIGNLLGGISSLAVGSSGQVVFGVTGGDPIFGNLTAGNGLLATPAPGTVDVSGIQATTAQIGVVTLASDGEADAGTNASKVIVPTSLKHKLGAQTLHGLPIGNATTAAIAWTAEPSNGQLLIGKTGNAPVLSSLTAGTNIAVTPGAGTITVALSIAAADHKVVLGTGAGGITSVTAVGTDGQLLVGSSGADPLFASLGASNGISKTEGAGTLSIAGIQSTAAQIGVVTLASGGEVTTGTDVSKVVTPATLTTKLGTQTHYALPVGGGAGSDLGWLAVGLTGQTLMGNTGANCGWTGAPSFLTSATAPTMYATTFDTNVVAAALQISGTTITSAGTNATIGLTISPKNAGTVTLTSGNFSATTGSIIAAAGSISATLGAVSAGTTVTAATNLVSTAGNLLLPTTTSSVGQIQIGAVPWAHSYGTRSVYVGENAGNFTMTIASAKYNVGVGWNALMDLNGSGGADSGYLNTCVGYRAGASLSGITVNNAARSNTIIGGVNAVSLTQGSYNLLLGASVGSAYNSDESSNILIGYSINGTAGENNVLRIGDSTGTSVGYLNAAYINGISSKTSVTTYTKLVQIDTNTSQLGTVNIIASYQPYSGTSTNILAGLGLIPTNTSLVTFTLPTSAAVGDVFSVVGNGNTAGVKILAAATTQYIHSNSTVMPITAGKKGYVSTASAYGTIELVCVTANVKFVVKSMNGTWTLNEQ